jgi:hypothetical protein
VLHTVFTYSTTEGNVLFDLLFLITAVLNYSFQSLIPRRNIVLCQYLRRLGCLTTLLTKQLLRYITLLTYRFLVQDVGPIYWTCHDRQMDFMLPYAYTDSEGFSQVPDFAENCRKICITVVTRPYCNAEDESWHDVQILRFVWTLCPPVPAAKPQNICIRRIYNSPRCGSRILGMSWPSNGLHVAVYICRLGRIFRGAGVRRKLS